MKVGIYARISTGDQNTLPMQIEAMKKYVSTRNWQVVTQIEDTESGASERPQREQLIKAARKRDIDVIIVWRLDRWGRSVTDLVTTLHELNQLGVGFISLTEALDLTTASGRAMAGMLAIFAEFERELLRERVRAGIQHAKRLGKPHGRPQTAAKQINQIKVLFNQGLSQSKIAKELKIGRTSVRRLLSQKNQVPISCQDALVDVAKTIKVNLWLQVENNSKFVRGKTKVRQDIEYFILSEYDARKLHKDGWEYELTIPYKTDKELDDIIYNLLRQMSHTADLRNCFIEADMRSLDGEKSW